MVPKVTVEVLESQAGVLWLGLEEGKLVMCLDVTAREAVCQGRGSRLMSTEQLLLPGGFASPLLYLGLST